MLIACHHYGCLAGSSFCSLCRFCSSCSSRAIWRPRSSARRMMAASARGDRAGQGSGSRCLRFVTVTSGTAAAVSPENRLVTIGGEGGEEGR